MTPVRLARRGSVFDQRLVRAARGELPVAGAEDRALAALGLSVLAAPVAAPARVSSRLLRAGTLKWMTTVIAVVATGAVALLATRAAPTLSRTSPPVPAVASVRELPVVAPPAAQPAPVPSPPLAPPVLPPPRPHRLARAPLPETALSAEIALVQQAAQALTQGNPDTSLSILNTYESRYPRGLLATEAGYLRVQVLLAKADRGGALDLARRLLAADPHGVLAPKLRTVIESEPIP